MIDSLYQYMHRLIDGNLIYSIVKYVENVNFLLIYNFNIYK